MKICRFKGPYGPRVGVVEGSDTVADLGTATLREILDAPNPADHIRHLADQTRLSMPIGNLEFLPPVEHQEVWAAGVTYQRSKTARMEESQASASLYDKVYEAPRPELFFKSLPEKVIGIAGMSAFARMQNGTFPNLSSPWSLMPRANWSATRLATT